MDVHGTRLARTLFTIATDAANSQKRQALCKEKCKRRAAFARSSSQALGG